MRSLELDDTVAAAHHSLADVKKGCDWDWSAAEAEYRRSLAAPQQCRRACMVRRSFVQHGTIHGSDRRGASLKNLV